MARKISKKPEKGIPERASKRKSMPWELKLARKGHTQEIGQKKKYAPGNESSKKKGAHSD
ncbi:MAG: hypothetical protein IIX48_06970 [Lachnospiraceae bacterium]|nr:hypothetical protein [Lachnospiraceae bacterium]